MSQLNKKPIRATTDVKLAEGRKLGFSKNGNLQYKKDSAQALFDVMVSCLYGKDSFYESGSKRVERAKQLLAQVVADHGLVGIEFAARAIVFARTKMNIRTMPIVMAVELMKLAQAHNGRVSAYLDTLQVGYATSAEYHCCDEIGHRSYIDMQDLNVFQAGVRTEAGADVVNATIDELRAAAPVYTDGRKLIAAVINRADELTDLYAYALTVFGEKGKIPLALKKGVADAFQKFDGYQLAKYNRDGQVTLKRLLRIVHATPVDGAQSEVFAKIMTETLEPAHTWESVLSENGKKPAGQRLTDEQLWTDLLSIRGPGEVPYMALLRNLRNIYKARVGSDVLRVVADRIRDPKEVSRSKQLPWAFINAYNMLEAENASRVLLNAVSDAAELSLGNMPKLGDRLWVILDQSASMNEFDDPALAVQEAKKPTAVRNAPIKIAAIFTAALMKANKDATDFKVTMFGTGAKFATGLNPNDSIMTLYKQVMNQVSGGGTNIQAAIEMQSRLGYSPDAIVVLSDMEVNATRPNKHGQILSVPTNLSVGLPRDAVKVAVNLNASETTPLDPRDGWLILSGWSENIFRYIDYVRNGASVVDKLFSGQLGDYR